MAMTPKQRWRALLEGQRSDRVPCDYWATAELTARLKRDLGCTDDRDLWAKLGIDKCIYLAPRHPRATEDTWHMPSRFSLWHVETQEISYGEGIGVYEETINPPLAEANTPADLEGFAWPDPDEWDVASYREECEKWPDHPILGASYEPFYLYCRLRGMEQALEDVVTNPDFVDALMGRIHAIHESAIRRILDAVADRIDFVYVAEDLGTQESLLMSPRAFRRFIKPWLARMIDLAHSYGVFTFHHDDGAIRPVLPDLIEIGIDLLNPIQWRCKGMEREALARDFGASVVFHGGVDNQHTLPFGSADDVRREVRENIEIFRPGKGYIVSPCHNLQANTPTENVIAMYDAVREFGR